MSDFKVVVPARFGSSRLPGKPLADIDGVPMVVHVVLAGQQPALQATSIPSQVQPEQEPE